MISFVNTKFESAPRDNGHRTFLLTENRFTSRGIMQI